MTNVPEKEGGGKRGTGKYHFIGKREELYTRGKNARREKRQTRKDSIHAEGEWQLARLRSDTGGNSKSFHHRTYLAAG